MASTCPASRAVVPPRVCFAPEALESRCLLSVSITAIGGTTTVGVGDFNGDTVDDTLLFARTRRARLLVALAGSLDTRPRSSLFIVDGADGSLIGGGVQLPARGNRTGVPLIAPGDFNEDGNQDLAIANSNRRGGGILVLLGNGDGTFDRAPLVPAPANITALATADVNGDGNLDLVGTVARGLSSGRPGLGAGTGGTLAPDFRHQIELAAGLLAPPATAGGVTAEAGGATDSFGGNTNPFQGVDTTPHIGLGPTQQGVVTVSPSLTAGTLLPMPGASAETGGSIAVAGSPFSFTSIGAGDDLGSDTFILLGNGDGTFRSPGRNG